MTHKQVLLDRRLLTHGLMVADVIRICTETHIREGSDSHLSVEEEERLRRLPLIAEGLISSQRLGAH